LPDLTSLGVTSKIDDNVLDELDFLCSYASMCGINVLNGMLHPKEDIATTSGGGNLSTARSEERHVQKDHPRRFHFQGRMGFVQKGTSGARPR
jgi:hypothetical protein